MKLSEFQKDIDTKILDRGMDYFKKEKILDVRKEDELCYTFTVQGTKRYTVIVKLKEDDDTLIETMCDCPYHTGPYCKHQVAAFFYLQYSAVAEGSDSNYANMRLSLSRLYKNELIEMLIDLSSKYPSEKNHLLTKHKKYRLYPDLRHLKMTFVEKIESYLKGGAKLNSYTLMDMTDDLAQLVDITKEIDDPNLYFNTQFFFYTEVVMLKDYTNDQFGSIDALLMYIIFEMKQSLTHYLTIKPAQKLNIISTMDLTLDQPLYHTHTRETVQLVSTFKDQLEEEAVRNRFITVVKKRMNSCIAAGDEQSYDRLNQLKSYVEKWYED